MEIALVCGLIVTIIVCFYFWHRWKQEQKKFEFEQLRLQQEYNNQIERMERDYAIMRATVHEQERQLLQEEEMEAIREDAQASYETYRQEQARLIANELDAKKRAAEKEWNLYVDNIAQDFSREENILKRLKIDTSTEIAEISKYLSTLRTERDNVVAALKAEEEVNNNIAFHSFSLSIEDKDDIAVLTELVHRMHKLAPIHKLIWSEYYQRIYGEMADRVLGKEKITGIYKITHIPTKKCYIGQAVDVRTRWANHIKTALHVDGGAAHARFHDALEELGLENFTWELLESCGKEKLNERERFYIEFYKSNDWGWNSTKGNVK